MMKTNPFVGVVIMNSKSVNIMGKRKIFLNSALFFDIFPKYYGKIPEVNTANLEGRDLEGGEEE